MEKVCPWYAWSTLGSRMAKEQNRTTATHCCTASATDYFNASNAWSQAPVLVTRSHRCYGSCTGCQFVCESCSRSLGSYISRSVERLPRTLLTTVALCRTLVVAHCGPIPMTYGSCSCREHIINSVIGVSRPPVLDCRTIFKVKVKVKVKVAFISIIINDKNKLDTVITKLMVRC